LQHKTLDRTGTVYRFIVRNGDYKMTNKQEIIARVAFWIGFALVAYVYIDQALNILANQGI